MDNLFTWLIILAAIISFLNKIFGKKKKPQATRGQPPPKPKPVEWIPPWLQPDEFESPVDESVEEELDALNATKHERPLGEGFDQKEDPSNLYVEEKKKEPAITREKIVSSQAAAKRLKALKIDLSTSDDLRKGIVLAEILGPCRARRYLTRG